MRRISTIAAITLLFVAACGDDAENNVSVGNNATTNNATTSNNGTTGANNTSTGANNTSTGANNTSTGPNSTSGDIFLPAFSELEEGWNELRPGGETICSRGTEWAFYVYKGDPNKVVVDFFGGGACWNATTCSLNDQFRIFSEDIENVRSIYDAYKAGNEDVFTGIYDHSNGLNPFADWTHVLLPYCTGDIHWGNNTKNYGPDPGTPGEELIIEHKGAVNTNAMLDWLYLNVEMPEKVFVTGCSAGSYGSAMWAPHIMRQYDQADVYQFGDSGAGVITETFFRDSFPSWNAEDAFPDWIPALDPEQVDLLSLELADLYIGVADFYSEQIVSQFNTRIDNNQVFFYEAMGGMGGAQGWSDQMLASVATIDQASPNFYSYTAAGDKHCIIPYPEFYTVEVNGRLLTEWLDDMVNDQPIEDVACDACVSSEL